ncbi:MAG: MarR family transcriptional regulator [Methyloligellaceae bacterium]
MLAQLRRREGINQTTLADILEIENITLARHIDRLEEKGWVERRRDPDDRRAWKLYFKEQVQPVLDQMRELSLITRSEALNGVSEADRERLIEVLLKIKSNMMELADADATGDSVPTGGRSMP